MGDDAGVVGLQVVLVEACCHAFGGNGLGIGGLAQHPVVAHHVLGQLADVLEIHGEGLAAFADLDVLGIETHLVSALHIHGTLGGQQRRTGQGQHGCDGELANHWCLLDVPGNMPGPKTAPGERLPP
ncbi:hypothetical protein D3C77_639200 [compost metagenome]